MLFYILTADFVKPCGINNDFHCVSSSVEQLYTLINS